MSSGEGLRVLRSRSVADSGGGALLEGATQCYEKNVCSVLFNKAEWRAGESAASP